MLNRSAARPAGGRPTRRILGRHRAAARQRLPRDRQHGLAQPADRSAAGRGTATPAPTCPARPTCRGTTASRTPSSPSAPTSTCGTARCRAARRRSCPAATAPAGWRPRTGSYDPDLDYDGRRTGPPRGDGGRRRPLRLRRLAPRLAGRTGRTGPVLPAVPLRPARHRPTPAHHGRGQPGLARRGDRRAATPRERALIGLHEPFFYDG